MITRRLFLAGLFAAGAGAALQYARALEPSWLELQRHRLVLGSGGKPPLRLLQLGDLHYSADTSIEHIDEAITLGLAQAPDLIALVGDYISRRPPDAQRLVESLRRLSSSAPTFAVMGNHDGGQWVAQFGGYHDSAPMQDLLRQAGISILHNAATEFELGRHKLTLVGLGDTWAGECSPLRAFAKPMPEDAPVVVLSHNPDSKSLLRLQRWDLMLCGHTHGGQVVIPELGWAPFAPVEDRRYLAGVRPWGDRLICVTKGVGSGPALRFNCRPEVTMLEIA